MRSLFSAGIRRAVSPSAAALAVALVGVLGACGDHADAAPGTGDPDAGAAGAGGAAGAAGIAGKGGAPGIAGKGGAPEIAGKGGAAGIAGKGGAAGIAGKGGAGAAGAGGQPVTVIAGPTLRVASFNVRLDTASDGADRWDVRKPIFFQVWKDIDADLVGVQEARPNQIADMEKALAGWGRVGKGRDGGQAGEHSDIFYRKSRFTVKASETFWLSPTPAKEGSIGWDAQFPRICTWARLEETSSGYHLYHFNTHLDHVGETARQRSAVLITQRIHARSNTDEGFVLTGDFNVGEGSAVTRFLKGNEELFGTKNPVPMRDTFREVNPADKQSGTAHGFGSDSTTGAKIDYVYAGDKAQKVLAAKIVHTKVNGRYPSDHYPIWATLQLPDQQK